MLLWSYPLQLGFKVAFRACLDFFYFLVSGFLLTEPEGNIKDEAAHCPWPILCLRFCHMLWLLSGPLLFRVTAALHPVRGSLTESCLVPPCVAWQGLLTAPTLEPVTLFHSPSPVSLA